MKKTLSLVLIILMSLTLFSCGNKPSTSTNEGTTAASVIGKALEQARTNPVHDMTLEMNMDMKMMGTSQVLSLATSVQVENPLETEISKMRGAGRMNTAIMGQEIDFIYYIVDGEMCISGMGANACGSVEDMSGLTGSSTEDLFNTQQSIFGSDLDGVDFTLVENADTYVLTADVSDAEVINKLLKEATSSASASEGFEEVNFSNFTLEMILDKEYNLVSQDISYVMSGKMQGYEVEADVELVITINNPGQPVVIDFPDFSSFARY